MKQVPRWEPDRSSASQGFPNCFGALKFITAIIIVYIQCIFIFYCLFAPTNSYIYIYIYITILNNTTDAPTCFGVSASSAGSFDIAFAKVIKY